MLKYIPPDNQEQTQRFIEDGKGVCGISCLAVIEERKVKDSLKDFDSIFGFKGYANVRDLRKYLQEKGYKVKSVNKDGYKDFSKGRYIARIQWIGQGKKREQPFYGWNHWTEASSHTHFIVIKEGMFFCNEENKWQSLPRLHKYLAEGNGIMTSYLEVKESETIRV